jgi:hypothetical protein
LSRVPGVITALWLSTNPLPSRRQHTSHCEAAPAWSPWALSKTWLTVLHTKGYSVAHKGSISSVRLRTVGTEGDLKRADAAAGRALGFLGWSVQGSASALPAAAEGDEESWWRSAVSPGATADRHARLPPPRRVPKTEWAFRNRCARALWSGGSVTLCLVHTLVGGEVGADTRWARCWQTGLSHACMCVGPQLHTCTCTSICFHPHRTVSGIRPAAPRARQSSCG